MRNIEKIVKKQRAKMQPKAPAAGGPGKGKVEALATEIIENREALDEIKAKENVAKAAEEKTAKKSAAKSDLIEHETKPIKESELEVFKVEPPKNPNEICPFCGDEKSARGMNRHIATIHEVPGVTVQDLDDVENGLKSLPDLVAEKFEGEATIVNLSPEVEEKEFSDWFDVEEDPEDPEAVEDPEDLADPEGQKDPEKEAGKNGGIGLLPIIFIVGIPAAMILSRIPKFKEFGDKLLATLGDLGSKEAPGSKSSFNYKGPSGGGPFNRF